MWCTCTDSIKCCILFDRYVRSLREKRQCECSLQRGKKSLSEQYPNLQGLWFPTSWLQSGNEKGWTGGSWCQSPFVEFWLLGLRASADSSAAVQPGFRELFEEELWEALAEAIPLCSGAAFNLSNCPCPLSGAHCIHSSLIRTDPLASTAWLDLTPASVFLYLPAVQLGWQSPGCSALLVQVVQDVSVRPLPCCPWPGSPHLRTASCCCSFSLRAQYEFDGCWNKETIWRL